MTHKILYEVALSIDSDIRDLYLEWLDEHVQEILRLPGFTQAKIWSSDEGDTVCQYTLDSRSDLDRYLKEDAPRFRQDGVSRFGGKFKATRRILELQRSFD